MRLFYAIKRGLAAIALPVALFSLAAYFAWHAQQGEHSKAERIGMIASAQRTLDDAVAERDRQERRVQGLRGSEVDRDQLDERARALLNMLGRDEIVMPYGAERRLFR